MPQGILPLVWMFATFGSMAVLSHALVRLRHGTASRRVEGLLLIGITTCLVLAASGARTAPMPALVGMTCMAIAAAVILRSRPLAHEEIDRR